jgi:hypothetical protein
VLRGQRNGSLRSLISISQTGEVVRPRCKFEDNIKINLKEVERNYVDWIHLAKDRAQYLAVVKTIMNVWVI